jgi:hypothetical protein
MKLEMSQPQPERPKPVRFFCLSFFHFFCIFRSPPPFPPATPAEGGGRSKNTKRKRKKATPAAGLSRSLSLSHFMALSCRFLVLSLSLAHARSVSLSRSLSFSRSFLTRCSRTLARAARALSAARTYFSLCVSMQNEWKMWYSQAPIFLVRLKTMQ